MAIYEFTFKRVESGATPEEAWEVVVQDIYCSHKLEDMPKYEVIEEDE